MYPPNNSPRRTLPPFLVLGIGPAQVDLIKKLFGRYYIHGLADSADTPGLHFLDEFAKINITDMSAVLEYAQRHKIEHIYSAGSSAAVPTIAWVASQLGLRHFVNYTTASLCENKANCRRALADSQNAVLFTELTSPDQPVSLPLPAIVKPVDSQGQRGLTVVENSDHLPDAFRRAVAHSRTGRVIVEQFIVGTEISVNAHFVLGRLAFFIPSDRRTWPEFDGGIIRAHSIPASINAETGKHVQELVESTAQRLGITDGPAYFQIKVQSGVPYLMEVSPRLDGCHLWRLILACTGIDVLDAAILHLTGEVPSFPEVVRTRPGRLEFFCQPPGTQFTIPTPDPLAHYSEYYYARGSEVRAVNGKMEKCGYQIVLG